MQDWQAGSGRRTDRREEAQASPSKPPQTPTAQDAERLMLMGIRQGLLMMVAAIEKRYDIEPSKRRE